MNVVTSVWKAGKKLNFGPATSFTALAQMERTAVKGNCSPTPQEQPGTLVQQQCMRPAYMSVSCKAQYAQAHVVIARDQGAWN